MLVLFTLDSYFFQSQEKFWYNFSQHQLETNWIWISAAVIAYGSIFYEWANKESFHVSVTGLEDVITTHPEVLSDKLFKILFQSNILEPVKHSAKGDKYQTS